ncbi:anti-anti-sigma regulatory factor [Actinoplanes lutulentus]|uniref:Anti-anti-sigma regulatory factor n=1 Tax=Actinoplanes lutulentus TaxID=1287878 RepID=A0A327Z948_9ACTN|nr:STAS domain-containing protein [Actinoplanes lutulentus]MBB2947712.1 anti-anti-sigma regulatory factor [Actinoplanes lutulentus]RAK27767.1 anti-anti-sigma regulatory factor [Actinoplanes lutulentus]
MLTTHSPVIWTSEHDEILLVEIRDGIDEGVTAGLRDVLAWAVDRYEGVVVDLSAATTIDRSGLSVLLQIQERAHLRDSRIHFAEPSTALRAALAALNADEMFEMFSRRSEAMARLRDEGAAAR